MAKLTIFFGVLLIILAAAGFLATGHTHPTALIPAIFGLLLILFGALATSEDAKKRMLWMHIAVTIGLIGFLATIKSDIDVVRLSRGAVFPHPIAVLEKAGMSLICLLFVALCVRSFIAARQQRLL